MATAPIKLHNFPLTSLQWGSKSQVNNLRSRRPVDSPPPPPISQKSDSTGHPVCRRSPSSDADYDSRSVSAEPEHRKPPVGSRSARSRITFVDRKQKQNLLFTPEREKENGSIKEKSKRVDPTEEGRATKHSATVVVEARAEVSVEGEIDDSTAAGAKPWNLRPRRAVTKLGIEIGSGSVGGSANGSGCDAAATATAAAAAKNGDSNEHTENMPKSSRLRGLTDNGCGEKGEKRKLWIALSRDEIEEDIYSMTGMKPSRKTKKRAKAVQKQVDNVFPGLWLAGISPESYKGLDVPPKR